MHGVVDVLNVTCLLSKQFDRGYHNPLDIVPPYTFTHGELVPQS